MIPENLKAAILAWSKASGLDMDGALAALAHVLSPDVAVLRASAGFPLLHLKDETAARAAKGDLKMADSATAIEEAAAALVKGAAATGMTLGNFSTAILNRARELQAQRALGLKARPATLTSEEKDFIRKQGLDPEKVAARA